MALRGARARPRVVDVDDVDDAERCALRILAGAAQSATGLTRRLERRGFSPVTVEQAVARCRELGYVDDSMLAASVATRHTRRGHGAARVAADLRSRGMDRDVIDATVAAMSETEEAAVLTAAEQLIAKQTSGGATAEVDWRRVGAQLQRRGFSSTSIRAALRALAAQQPS